MRGDELGVVIPTLNSARTLSAALESLRAQVGTATKVVVVDSGSTDGTLDVCSAWGVETRYVPPGNMYRAINEGLRLLQQPWLAYLNADDFVYTDAYARLIRVGETALADVVYGHGDFVDAHGRFLYCQIAPPPPRLGPLLREGVLAFLPHGAIFRRSIYQELGGFSEDYRHIADLDFFARAYAAGRQFARVRSRSVAVFRKHPTQISRAEAPMVAEEIHRWLGRSPRRLSWSLVQWKLANLTQYAIRLLRTGSLRGYAAVDQ